MPETMESLIRPKKPTAERPLLGRTVLVVEDSRLACEAMRLLCLRSGARIRRADCLASARRHLSLYKPEVLVVDLGLPDGSGAELIEEMSQSSERLSVIIGMSGDPDAEHAAMEAGADVFLSKPLKSLALFQETILSKLPVEARPLGVRVLNKEDVSPDPIALRDDLAHIAEVISTRLNEDTIDYIAQFLGSVAVSAQDTCLQGAAGALANSRASGDDPAQALSTIGTLVNAKLSEHRAI